MKIDRLIRTSAAALGLLATAIVAAPASAATITPGPGMPVSVYSNPFDPDLDFNSTEAGETSTVFGNPTTGNTDGWALSSPSNPLAHVVSRRDGRNFQHAETSARLSNNDSGARTPAYMQFQTAAGFEVGTVITAHSINFGFANPQPYTLKLNSGSPGLTTADWASVPVFSAGPGTQNTHPISVITPDTIDAFDTMRIEFAQSSNIGTTNSQVSFQEVVILPEKLKQVGATLTSQSAGGTQPGEASNNDGFNVWFDQTNTLATNKFFELTLDELTVVRAIVLFADNAHPGQQLRVRQDGAGGAILFDVALESFTGEVLPIALDKWVETSVLRFEWLGHATTGNVASMREVLVLTYIPEPASALLLSGMVVFASVRRRRAA